MDLFEALEVDKCQHGIYSCISCIVCTWMATLSFVEQEKWDKAFSRPNKEYSNPSLLRVARDRGFVGGTTAILRHRNAKHRQDGIS